MSNDMSELNLLDENECLKKQVKKLKNQLLIYYVKDKFDN